MLIDLVTNHPHGSRSDSNGAQIFNARGFGELPDPFILLTALRMLMVILFMIWAIYLGSQE